MKSKIMLKTFFKVMIGNKKEMQRVIPKAYFNSVYDIDYKKLKEKGITCLLFDIDGTIAKVDDLNISDEIKQLFSNLKEFKIILISNNDSKRVLPVSKVLNVPSLYSAKKPTCQAYETALKMLKVRKKNACMIGDQILTDIFGANNYGIYSILVNQMSNQNNLHTKIAHILQCLMIKKLRKKKLLEKNKFYMN